MDSKAEGFPERRPSTGGHQTIGIGRRRIEGGDKITGRATYTADLRIDGLTYARLVLSTHAHARIKGIDTSAVQAIPGVIGVFTGDDLPEGMANGRPEDALARGWVTFVGQPVAVVVGETEAAAADGAESIAVDYEPEPAVTELFSAMAEDAPIVLQNVAASDEAAIHGAEFGGGQAVDRPRNATSAVRFADGDISAAFELCSAVVEHRYEIAGVHQGFLEPHVSMARAEANGTITIWTSSQARFEARDEVAKAMGLEPHSVVANPMEIGGGFGGKFFLLEPLVALLSVKTSRPVLLALTRTEEFLMGRAGPACVIDLKIGAGGDGILQALYARVYYNSGACAGFGGEGSSFFLRVPYRLAAYDVAGFDIATHTTPTSAYRAPSGPQAFFALESAIDELAERLGLDPLAIRIKNAVREGDPDPSGTPWPRIGFVECLEEARRNPIYSEPPADGEGVGVAVGAWGGANAPAQAECRVGADGVFVLKLGTVDVTGTDTTFQMIAAETLGISPDLIRLEKPDSSQAPPAPGSGGSVTTYSVGPAVQAAAGALRRRLLEMASETREVATEDLEMIDGVIRVRGVPESAMAIKDLAAGAVDRGDEHRLNVRGEASLDRPSWVFTVQVARAVVDPETGQFEVNRALAVQDVGKAINPPEVEGQIHGGALQGFGRAMGEEMVYDSEGQLRTASFLDYRLPTIDQAPALQVRMLEIPSELGPFGAKHVGEPPAIPGAAAVANAVSRASGVRITRVPIDPALLIRR